MENFLQTYQKLITPENTSDSAQCHAQRKSLALMYNASLKTLDEQSTCHLLENKLNNYHTNSNKYTNMNNIIKSTLGVEKNAIHLESSLTNVDTKSLIKPLPCSPGEIHCQQAENVTTAEFNEFKRNLTLQSPRAVLNRQNGANIAISKRNSEENFPKLPQPQNKQGSSKQNEDVAGFRSATEVLLSQSKKKMGNSSDQQISSKYSAKPNVLHSKFVSPVISNNETSDKKKVEKPEAVDERLKNIEPDMVQLIKNEIMDVGAAVTWSDIAGLEFAKTSIQEAVVWPMLRPDLFTGLRRPPKGILLFGPPGTGKTLIGKCVASQSKSTFFSISASSLTSKWVGNGEKMVRALFAVARCHQPAVIFIDEIDSLLTQRSETEHESSRRIKTEFLVQLDGATTDGDERLLLIAATNRPQELDEAARRRFVKRLYIPLPDSNARHQLITRLIKNERHLIDEQGFRTIAEMSEGYSGADIRNLCAEASLEPIRSIDMSRIESITAEDVRDLIIDDFHKAFSRVRSSVSPNDLDQYVKWDKTYGSGL